MCTERYSSIAEDKALKDDEILQNLPVGTTATMYFRDLGPQIGWTMVSCERLCANTQCRFCTNIAASQVRKCISAFFFLIFCLQVFFAECIGSLLSYLVFYFRVPYIYSQRYVLAASHHSVVT